MSLTPDAHDLVAIMVDGKSVRGALDTPGNQVHLLAAAILTTLEMARAEFGFYAAHLAL